MLPKPTSLFFRLALSFLLAGITAVSYAQNIKGGVFDAKTGEPLSGATVHIEKTKYTTIVNLDGSYIFKNVAPGNYQIAVSLAGYSPPKSVDIEVSGNKNTIVPDFKVETSVATLSEVVVTGSMAGISDKSARSLEKNAVNVENILSEKSIQLSPDLTVANALQRVSGVTIQRDNTGEGRYAIIRGMDQRYNTTLVNGIKIPSPDDRYRFVPMNIFPSDMLQRLEVIKTLTPNMEGDAIGGTMNLVMKSAPENFLLNASISGGYNTIFSSQPFTTFSHSGINKKSPAEIYGNSYVATPSNFPFGNLNFSNQSNLINSTMGLTVGDRFLDKKLGVILSASYQNFYQGATSERLVPDAQPLPAPSPNTLNPSDAYVRQYSNHTNRLALQNKNDYVINDRNIISLFNMYLHQNVYETRYTPDSVVGLNSSATQATVTPEYRSRWQIQDIYNATLHGDHQLSDNMKFDWTGVYSIAKQQIPDMATYNFDLQVLYNEGKISQADSTIPVGTANVMTRTWQHNTDQDLAGYANLTYYHPVFKTNVEFETGGLYRYKTRDNYYNMYALQSSAPSGTPFHSIETVPLYFQTPGQATGAVTAETGNTYTAHEQIIAGYIQAKFTVIQYLQILLGVRVENTQQDYKTALPPTSTIGAYGTIQYTDVLPGIHLKYALTDKQNLWLSYYKSISRPSFGDLVPTTDPSNEEFTQLGNPYLKHVRADNFDLRYGWFPGHADQLLLGVFYKNLQNPIEYFVTNLNGPSSLYIQPQNTGNATNFGFEAVYTKYFGMFGVSFNYTYTHSQITTTKLLYLFVPGVGNQTQFTTQTRPLQGQANNIGNLSLLYKNPRFGFDAQLAFSYTGDRIAQVSPYYNLDIWQKPFSQLDLSVQKNIAKHFSFFGKVNNLTNSPSVQYIKFPYTAVNSNFHGGYTIPFQVSGSDYTVAQRDIYKINFVLGFRYIF